MMGYTPVFKGQKDFIYVSFIPLVIVYQTHGARKWLGFESQVYTMSLAHSITKFLQVWDVVTYSSVLRSKRLYLCEVSQPYGARKWLGFRAQAYTMSLTHSTMKFLHVLDDGVYSSV
jgi:hypothetical protein